MVVQWLRRVSSVEGVLLLEKKTRERLGSQSCCAYFGQSGDHTELKDESLAIQKLKHSFVYNLSSWNEVSLDGEAHSMLGFLD